MKNYHISLFRHGKTAANESGVYIGSTDYPLSDRGRNELYDELDRFSYPRVDRVYTSPLRRCEETAQILFPHRELCPAPEFEELHFGDFEGKRAEDLVDNADYRAWLKGGLDARPPRGESVAELTVRSFRGLERIFHEMMREELSHVAIVSHAGVIVNLLACFGLPKFDPKKLHIAAGEGYEIQINPGMWQSSQAFEILRKTPLSPEETDTF